MNIPIKHKQQTNKRNALIYGRKLWILLQPSDSLYSSLQPLKWLQEIENGNNQIDAFVCIQEQGQIMFVPENWGHAVIVSFSNEYFFC